MHRFHCDRCGHEAGFTAQRCSACDAPLGYVPEQRTIRALTPAGDPAVFRADGHGRHLWRCLNASWGCNWMLPAAAGTEWCRSCQLTRGRPDETRPVALAAWMAAEAAKRRLVNQLDQLALPFEIRSTAQPDGLAFDLVHLPGKGGITGHLDGIVTLDLAETDDLHRDDLRRRLGEPFRTVIGHLRHEIGHYFWGRLVGQSDDLVRFRRLFGDERADYRSAVESYYSGGNAAWDRTRFVTSYAASHPLEDWADSFAHYLHIIDAIDTAVAHDLVPPASAAILDTDTISTLDFERVLDAWRPVNSAVNAIAETLGAPVVYPFEPTGVVVDKLAFVHQQIAAHTERNRFYAIH
jgi:hypothetical protein